MSFRFLLHPAVLPLIVGISLALVQFRTRRVMAKKGFRSLSFREAMRLSSAMLPLGEFPTAEEVRADPSYRRGDVDSLIEVATRYIGERRRAGLIAPEWHPFAAVLLVVIPLAVVYAVSGLWASGHLVARIFAGILAAWLIWGLTETVRATVGLWKKGYDWVRPTHAFVLCFSVGVRVHRIPCRDDVMASSGYVDRDVNSLIRIARKLRA